MTTKGEKKYPTAQDWFLKNYQNFSKEELHRAMVELMRFVDADDIQFLFQEEMEKTGFFEE